MRHKLTSMRKEHRAKRMRNMSQVDTSTFNAPYGGSNTYNMIPPPPPPMHINVPQGHGNAGSRVLGQAAIGNPNQGHNPPNNGNHPHSSHISAVTMGTQMHHQFQGGMMDGCNEQGQQRGRNPAYRNIHNVITKRRAIWTIQRVPEPKANTIAQNEADTNADTCCLGRNFIPIAYTNKSADVYPYNESYEPLENVPIVSAATAFDHPDGNTYILVVNDALYYGEKMGHSLINPNQIRHAGLDFLDNPMRDNELYFEADKDVKIPLRYKGTKYLFASRVPTEKEMRECIHFHITSDQEWDPASVDLSKCKISSLTSTNARNIYMVQTESILTTSLGPTYEYVDPLSDEGILSQILPSLIQLKELSIGELKTSSHPNEVFPAQRTFITKERQSQLTAESLLELWFIGPKRAYATLGATTQNGVRSAILPMSRCYQADRMYGVKRLYGRFVSDTFFINTKSLHHNTCAQVFSHKCGFSACYPMQSTKGEAIGDSLYNFVHDFGAPEHLTFDGFQSQVGRNTKFRRGLRHYNIDWHVSAPRRPNKNPAEGTICKIKCRFYQVMHKKSVPKRLWDYLVTWICKTSSLSVSSSKYANGRTAVEIITGKTPDISEYLDFGFYNWVFYRSNAGLGERTIRRWLGVSHKVGQMMSYWILPQSGIPVSCVNVQRMTNSEKQLHKYQTMMKR